MDGMCATLPLLPEPDTLLKASRVLAGELEGAWAAAGHLQELHLAEQMANLTGGLPAAWGAPGAFPRLQACPAAGPNRLFQRGWPRRYGHRSVLRHVTQDRCGLFA